MSYFKINFQKKGGCAVVTLRESLVSSSAAADIRGAFQEIGQDADIKVAVLGGIPGGPFCSGADNREIAQMQKDGGIKPEQLIDLFSAARAINSADKPVIAAITGDAFGQGLELALACDIRLAAPGARFGFPAESMKVFPFDGATQLLPRLVGKSQALEMLLTGDIINAETAMRIGLVNQIVRERDVLAEAEELAAKMASRAPISLRFAKEAVTKGMDMTLEQGLRLEGDLYFLMHTTHDRIEGITAFRQKRKPDFTGS